MEWVLWILLKRRGIELKDKRVLVLGAGGAARAICVYLLKEKLDELYVINRTREKVVELVKQLGEFSPNAHLRYIEQEDAIYNLQPDLIINTHFFRDVAECSEHAFGELCFFRLK